MYAKEAAHAVFTLGQRQKVLPWHIITMDIAEWILCSHHSGCQFSPMMYRLSASHQKGCGTQLEAELSRGEIHYMNVSRKMDMLAACVFLKDALVKLLRPQKALMFTHSVLEPPRKSYCAKQVDKYTFWQITWKVSGKKVWPLCSALYSSPYITSVSYGNQWIYINRLNLKKKWWRQLCSFVKDKITIPFSL